MRNKVEGPTNFECNCACHKNPKVKHAGKCCFVCPKCKKRIKKHLYNEHVHTCSRRKRLLERIRQERLGANPTAEQLEHGPKLKERLVEVSLVGTTRSRHRRRKPVGR